VAGDDANVITQPLAPAEGLRIHERENVRQRFDRACQRVLDQFTLRHHQSILFQRTV